MILSTYYNTLDYLCRYLDSVFPPLLIYSLTYADSVLMFLRRVAAVMTTTMESVSHDPELYVQYH
jgi:hypothetical protein